MFKKMILPALLGPILLLFACMPPPMAPEQETKTVTTWDTLTVMDTVTVFDTVRVTDSVPVRVDTTLHAPSSHVCSVGQVATLQVSVTPDTLHQSITVLSDDASIASVSGRAVTCVKLGTTFFAVKWTNGFIERTDTILVLVRPPPE